MHNAMWSWKHTHTHTHTQTTAVFVYNKSQQTACSLCSVWHIDRILHCDKLNMCPCGALWHCSRMNTHTEERNTIYVVLLFFKTWTKIYIFFLMLWMYQNVCVIQRFKCCLEQKTYSLVNLQQDCLCLQWLFVSKVCTQQLWPSWPHRSISFSLTAHSWTISMKTSEWSTVWRQLN